MLIANAASVQGSGQSEPNAAKIPIEKMHQIDMQHKKMLQEMEARHEAQMDSLANHFEAKVGQSSEKIRELEKSSEIIAQQNHALRNEQQKFSTRGARDSQQCPK